MNKQTWGQIREEIQAQINAQRENNSRPETCPHSEQRFVQYRLESGTMTLRKQCLACENLVGGALKRADVKDWNSLPVVTTAEMDAIRKAIWGSSSMDWQEMRDREQQTLNDAFWVLYNSHLRSDLWRIKRHAVLRRANGLCEGCGLQKPDHVHHRTYDNLGDEFLFELVALCEDCHQRIHPHRELKKEKSNEYPF